MLKKLLQSMLDEAVKAPKAVVKRKLKENLHIALAVTDKDVQISISRDKVYPSASEWKTVLANFPYQVQPAAPISFIDSDRRYAMRTKLPRREDVPQQLPLGTTENEGTDDG